MAYLPFRQMHFKRVFYTGLLTSLVAGCSSMQPKQLTSEELRVGMVVDRAAAQKDVEPVGAKVTLEEAIARALKYNLERRSRMMEEAIAFNQLESGKYDMLPKLITSAGYRWRDEDLITRSKDSVTGAPSLANPFISSDREHNVYDTGVSWNLLDFGTSYFSSKQNADRVMVAMERRRKAMHVLISDVRSAFWRTASAQKLQKQVLEAIALAEDALKDARKAEEERVRSPVESLRVQRQILENLRLLESTNQELRTARLELAHLMNVSLVSNFMVVEPDDSVGRKMLNVPIERLEELAVGRNADLRESFYNARIARDETRKVITRLFPSVSFNYNVKYDTDTYLVNQHWNEAGVSISWNLLNLVSGPSQMRLAEAGVALADQRRMTAQMAVLAQVHIARLQFSNALNQYDRAKAVSDVDARIDDIMAKREAVQVQSKLETVANKTTYILSLLRRYQALAQAHAAASKLQATLGVEPQFKSMQDMTLAQLTEVVARALNNWEAVVLPDAFDLDAMPVLRHVRETLPVPPLDPAPSTVGSMATRVRESFSGPETVFPAISPPVRVDLKSAGDRKPSKSEVGPANTRKSTKRTVTPVVQTKQNPKLASVQSAISSQDGERHAFALMSEPSSRIQKAPVGNSGDISLDGERHVLALTLDRGGQMGAR